ncbi:endonuclease domain-containing protein [Ciceribacter ferrooxidans]|uniref:Endonuclease domain-containing protein n=1 Tax=Ciceribacter ferrooxidans TaxID=2509717 RepID=A0A4V1RLU9_9HYPH|nr:DUF559 domain-containing protein [Ciceribacter ferrooxidans]RYB97080.1 endonuclease domain-containing protein [Ciceribacter ferrooxidans]
MAKSTSPLDRFKRANARRLRATMTDAERRLWRHLWRVPIEGTHFRRQVPIDRFFADFACHQVGLIIELDGSQHANDPARRYDLARTHVLEAAGYKVIRFWNHEVLNELDAVLDTIFAAVDERRAALALSAAGHPTPALRSDPPPQGEGD